MHNVVFAISYYSCQAFLIALVDDSAEPRAGLWTALFFLVNTFVC